MTDLIYLLNTLVDKDGKIQIEGLYNEVAQLSDHEKKIYEKIDFSVDEYRADVGCKQLMHNEKKEGILMHRWRYPSLSIHGIEGAFSEPGQKTVIPRKVIGKFSIRIVPNQEPKQIEKYVIEHMQKMWAKRGSPNKMKVPSCTCCIYCFINCCYSRRLWLMVAIHGRKIRPILTTKQHLGLPNMFTT